MNISRYIPFRIVKRESYDEYQNSTATRIDQALTIERLRESEIAIRKERDALLKKFEGRQTPVIDVRVGDPSPIDSKERALYVAQVAGLHKDILEPKFKQMISNLHQMLEDSTNDREFDQSVKGAIYFAWEVIRWGTSMVNEQISIQRGERPELSEEKIKE